ncbi:PadR family transcriptional regulator [Edaphobacter modestus]|uniref:PadR family transcriptional regulator n=1 Tax=Edaphobacter modestus TaxID=388466 RepID=A0A4Q7YNP2_9BACT|nr:PadR family transcriptional regulator [Edaphobacter modestus]RZU39382.1 PadR family transcriptional regulator [Edaphobacter modestus]
MGKSVDLLQGTLEILILKSSSLGPQHGYGILLRIQQISQGRLEIPQGSFYVALYRMEHKGLIEGEWGESENNRRAKFYKLTAAGRKQLKHEINKWTEMTGVVGSILNATSEAL